MQIHTATSHRQRTQYNKEHRNITFPQIIMEHTTGKEKHQCKITWRKEYPNPITTSKKE
jgi:hypothetical protein